MARRAQHAGKHAVNCPKCLTIAKIQQMPWHADIIDTLVRLPKIGRDHDKAIARQERAEAMRDLGMVKVAGGWE